MEIKSPYLIVQPSQGYFARPDAVGFFGNNFFETQDRVILDFIHYRIYTNKLSEGKQ
jgi:hypothetical protein